MVSTGQGLLSHNMYAYCNNNPINYLDPTGHSAIGTALYVIAMSIATNPQAIDSTVSTIAGAITAIGGIISSPIDKLTSSTKAVSKSASNVASVAKVASSNKSQSDTTIYRYGGANPGNLTPKEKDYGTGLSFSTIPKPGAVQTTINTINSTGILYAIQDKPTHVSVYPIGGTVEGWHNAGPTSVWTQTLKSIVIKWDGGL